MEGEVSESAPVENTAPPVVEVANEAPASHETSEQPTEKPAGFDPVDFSPAQLERFNRVYGNMKRYETDAKELKEDNQRLIDTVKQLAQGQQQIVSHIQGNDFQSAESKLAADRDAAWQKGDVNAFNSANDKLHEIKTQRLLAQQIPKQQPQVQQPQKTNGFDGERIADSAVDKGSINPAEANIAKSWMTQTDNSGNLLRPWTQPADSRNYAAALEAQAVFNSPMFHDKSMADKLREVDRRMGTQSQPSGQNVLGAGNLTRGKPNSNIKLDPKIEDIAVRTKFAGKDPKLTAQDHINAWQKAVTKSKGGARK